MALLEQARPRYSDRALRASAGLAPRSPLLAGAPSSPTIFRPEHGDAYILPAAPTHEPEDEPLPGQLLSAAPGLGSLFGAETDQALAEPSAADEGDEEVLEELRDETEELVSPDVLLSDLGGTLFAVHNATVLALQSLLESMASGASAEAPEESTSLSRIASLAKSIEIMSAGRGAPGALKSSPELSALIEQLNMELDRFSFAPGPSTGSPALDNLNLATALAALLSGLDRVREPAASGGNSGSADGDTSLTRSETARASQISGPGMTRRNRQGSAGNISAMYSSPSASREELRDPFAESAQSEQDVFTHLHSLMGHLVLRCSPRAPAGSPLMANGRGSPLLHSPSPPTSAPFYPAQSTLSSARNTPADVASGTLDDSANWKQLSQLLGITRELVAAQRLVQPHPRSILDSPSLSFRSRSRHGSTTSSLNGDMMLEEPVRARSRLSMHSTGSQAHAALAQSPRLASANSPLAQERIQHRSPSLKRESGSVTTHGHLPPRYSEESLRAWTTPAVAGASSPTAKLNDAARRDSVLSASSTNASLPAYASHLPSGSREEKKLLLDEKSRPEAIPEMQRPEVSSATSAYAARTSQDLRVVESSIDRLYSAVPQLDDQRVALSPRLQRDAKLEDVVERLARGGRMEEQRAAPVTSSQASSSTQAPAPAPRSPVGSFAVRNSLARRFSVGGSLQSLRRAANHTFDIKGKGRESGPRSSMSEYTFEKSEEKTRPTAADLDPLFDGIRAANEMRFSDQQAQMRPRTAQRPHTSQGRQSKLAQMGLGIGDAPDAASHADEDDELFNMLASTRRMDGQDAAPPSHRGTARLSSVSAARTRLDAAGRSPLGSPSLPLRSPSYRKKVPEALDLEQSSSVLDTPDSATPLQTPRVLPAESATAHTAPGEASTGETAAAASSSRAAPGECAERGVQLATARPDASGMDDRAAYIAECHGQLGAVSVICSMDTNSAASRLSFDTGAGGQSQAVSVSVSDGSAAPASLLLPVPVEAAQSGSATLGDDHFAFKLQTASHSERGTSDALLSAPLSAEVLQRRLPSHFACDACQEVIIDSSGTKTYRALPSQHWEELIDAWMCHDDQEINVSVTRGREGMEEGRRIADGDAWVADALIAWPGACASAGSLRMESRPTSSDASQPLWDLHCAACGVALGYAAPNLELGQPSSPEPPALQDASVRLHKRALLPITESVATACPSLFPILAANELYQLSQAHAARHFVVEEEDTGRPRAMLWLFLASCQLSLSPTPRLSRILHASSPDESGHVVLTASKVFFRDLTADEVAEHHEQRQQGSVGGATAVPWSMPAAVERLTYPARSCAALLEALAAANACYPPSRRCFGPWSVSFLEAVSPAWT